MNNLNEEYLSLNELLLLEKLVERLNHEIKLEDRTDSDIRLSINKCVNARIRVQRKFE